MELEIKKSKRKNKEVYAEETYVTTVYYENLNQGTGVSEKVRECIQEISSPATRDIFLPTCFRSPVVVIDRPCRANASSFE